MFHLLQSICRLLILCAWEKQLQQPSDFTAPSVNTVESRHQSSHRGAQSNFVSPLNSRRDTWEDSVMADTSPRTDTSTDVDTDDKGNQKVKACFLFSLSKACLIKFLFVAAISEFHGVSRSVTFECYSYFYFEASADENNQATEALLLVVFFFCDCIFLWLY